MLVKIKISNDMKGYLIGVSPGDDDWLVVACEDGKVRSFEAEDALWEWISDAGNRYTPAEVK